MKFFKTIIKLLIIISVIIFFVKCLKINTTQPCSDPFCGCPPPVHGIDGYQSPSLFYMNPRVSCNLNKVAFLKNGFVLNIWDRNTNQIKEIDISGQFNEPVQYGGIMDVTWCPYDESKILLNVLTFTDTLGNKKKYINGKNLYIYNLKTNDINKVTPPSINKAGLPGAPLIIWLKGSSINNDTIYITFQGFYYIQKNEMIKNYKYDRFCLESKDARFFLGTTYLVNSSIWGLMLNNNIITFSDTIMDIEYLSISPDGEKVAISVMPSDTTNNPNFLRFREIWIINTKDMLNYNIVKNKKIINLRKEFCKYANAGLFAEFVTNNSLVLSFHNDGDNIAPLYEISLDGKIIRQITDK